MPLNPRGPRARIVRANALRRWARAFRVRRALRGAMRRTGVPSRRVTSFIPRHPRAMVYNRFHPVVQAARAAMARRRLAAVRAPMRNVRRPRSVATRAGRRRLLRR